MKEREHNALTLGRLQVGSQAMRPNPSYYAQCLTVPMLTQLFQTFWEHLTGQVTRQFTEQALQISLAAAHACGVLTRMMYQRVEISAMVSHMTRQKVRFVGSVSKSPETPVIGRSHQSKQSRIV